MNAWAVPIGVVLGAMITGVMSLLTAAINRKGARESAITSRITAYDERLWEHRVPLYRQLASQCTELELSIRQAQDPDEGIANGRGIAEVVYELLRLESELRLWAEVIVTDAYWDLHASMAYLDYTKEIERELNYESEEPDPEYAYFTSSLDGTELSDISIHASILTARIAKALQGPEYNPYVDDRSVWARAWSVSGGWLIGLTFESGRSACLRLKRALTRSTS